jgi:glycosyltransferase involved in cell wall biosynthesis
MRVNKREMNNKHTFVICAYKESAYIRDCIESLKNQSIKSRIVCTTSTPNSYIEDICSEYDIPLYINTEQFGIASDWNFAYNQADSSYVTLAHQDDIYCPYFLAYTLNRLSKAKKPLIAFSDYYEIRDNKNISSNRLLKIKRIMCLPLRIRALQKSRFIARWIFRFGSPICCPSVTYAKENLAKKLPLFNKEYKVSCDFLTWVEIRDFEGSFVYCPKQLVGHRIHKESETTKRIKDNSRKIEDFKILKMLSPEPIAKLIHRFYTKSEKSNESKQ